MTETYLSLDQLANVLKTSIYKSDVKPSIEAFRSFNFITYIPPPAFKQNATQTQSKTHTEILNKYIERLKYIVNDLDTLLKLPFKLFYNQVLNDKSFQVLFESYLKYTPRPYESIEYDLNETFKNNFRLWHEKLRKSFFLCLYRLTSDNRETKKIDDLDILNSLYDCNLFRLSNFFDLIVVYEGNESVQKFAKSIYEAKLASYGKELNSFLQNMIKTFKINEAKLQNCFEIDNSIGKLSKKLDVKELYTKLDDNFSNLLKLVNYFIEISTLFNLFIQITSQICYRLIDVKFHVCLIEFIENTLIEIEDLTVKINKKIKSSNSQLLTVKLQILKYELMRLIEKIFDETVVSPITNKNYDSNHLEMFYKLYFDLLEYKKFVICYNENFDVLAKLNRIYKVSKDKIDKCQYDYIMENLRAIVNSKQEQAVVGAVAAAKSSVDEEIIAAKVENMKIEDKKVTVTEDIKSLLEIFPEYNEGFLFECLEYFNNNKDQLINAILEDNLPVNLKDKLNPKESKKPVNDSGRRNVFEGDQFDLKSKDKSSIDYTKIHIGKKNTSDKLLLNEPKAQKYTFQISNDQEYEDEYDDTYDANMDYSDVYQDETFELKPLNEKLGTRKRDKFDNEEEEIEGEEEEGGEAVVGAAAAAAPQQSRQQKNLNFVEDPAKVRERQQARYEARQAQRQRHHQNFPQAQNNEDGGGEAQDDAKVQRDRRYKNTNKAKVVHHNRRDLAMKKMNKSLFN